MTTPELEPDAVDAAEAARLNAEVARLTLLVEASSTLLGSLRLEDVLPRVLELARRILAADAYALWRYHRDRGEWAVENSDGLSERYRRAALAAIAGNASVVPLDAPLVAEDIETTAWLTPQHREAHRIEGNRAMMAIPLRRLDQVLGTLVFYYREPHSFTATERSAATTLANLAAVAIATAELYEAQARMAEDRAFLAEASAQLASSLEVETTLADVAALAVPRFADWCAIHRVRADGSIERLALAHADPEKAQLAEEVARRQSTDPDATYGPAHVTRTGEAELVPDVTEDVLEAAFPGDPELRRLVRELGVRSAICVPLAARDRVLGAISFVAAEGGRRYGEADLVTAQDLARRVAGAIDNALLFRNAEQAQRAAQESLGVLDSIYATAPVGLAFMDRDLRYVRINDALAAMNAGSAADFLGKSLQEVLGDVYRDVEPLHREVLETGRPRLGVLVTGALPAAPDEQKTWLSSYYPVRDAQGVVTGVGVAILDVTERERVRAEAEAARERLSVLAEASTLLASSLDYETTLANIATLLVPRYADWYAVDVLDENGSFRRLAVVHSDPAKREWAELSRLHYTAEPDEPEGTGRVVRTGESVLYREVGDDLLRSSTQDDQHYRVLRELGMESAMVVPLTAGGRTFGALLLVSSDPGRRYDEDDLDFAEHLGRRAAVAVDNALLYERAEARAQAALAVEYVGDGVMLVDGDGCIRLWNPAAAAITGADEAEVLGRRVGEVLHGWERLPEPPRAGERDAAVRRPETLPVELLGRELWLSISGVAFDDGVVYAFRDLTSERAVERLKTDFVSTVSHELRTPLAAIYGAALTLRRSDVRLPEPQRAGLLEVIASESDRLARIVNDILWASRLESGAMQTTIESCDGAALAGSVVEAARSYVPPNVTVAFTAEEGLPPVAADPDKLSQVLTNLVDNAIKYSPDGGRIAVSVAPDGHRVRFVVRDEGLGIPPTEQQRIFEKFFRLDPNLTRGVGGTGLGLYISRELIRRMGGRIWVESRGAGAGSTFVVELPAA